MNDGDLEVITQRGHGKGGQHQNKTDSAVRMKHLPTGLSVFINGRDQGQNKREAKKILTAKVNQLNKEQVFSKVDKTRAQQVDGGGRSNKIRTYNFIDNRAIDHRSGKKVNNMRQIMKGRFDLLIDKGK